MLCTEIIEPNSAAFVRGAIALETRKLSRAVVDKVLVNEVSAQVQWGEVLAVVGPSGAGKSSFLRLLNRLDEPTGGTVLVNGQDYHQIAARDLRRRVGMVLQMAYLFPGAVAANIAFGPMQRGENILRRSRLPRCSNASACPATRIATRTVCREGKLNALLA